MRVLFLHTAWSGVTAEYKVHTTLANGVESGKLDSYYLWQKPIPSDVMLKNQIIPHDFGRNTSITPKPNRYRRAIMMMQRLPKTLAFLTIKVRQLRPDVIYTSQQMFDIRLAQLLCQCFCLPHVIHIHYNVGPWLGKYALNTIRKSPRLIAVSEFVRQTALLQGVSPSNIHTIVNPAPIYPPQLNTAQNIRSELNLDSDTPLVVAVGRLDPGKGHLPLFEAFAKTVQQMPNARLLVCGISTSRDNFEAVLQQRVTELGLDPYVIFAGYRHDIQAIMETANVFCLPSELEPFGLVFLEAMMAGTPVVAYHSGGVPEIVLHNQTGLLSYPGDIARLAEHILQLLTNPDIALRLGQAGKQRASTEFNPSKVAERWLSVLHEKVK